MVVQRVPSGSIRSAESIPELLASVEDLQSLCDPPLGLGGVGGGSGADTQGSEQGGEADPGPVKEVRSPGVVVNDGLLLLPPSHTRYND